MAVTKPRNRTVLFRLTQEEYSALQAACSAGSARSLSDFARERILADASNGSTPLEQQVGELAAAVARLVLLIEGGALASSKRADNAATAYAPARLVSNS